MEILTLMLNCDDIFHVNLILVALIPFNKYEIPLEISMT